jgi:hypothetical protein
MAERDWKSYTAAILGSSLILFIVTTLYSALINKPIINIEPYENGTIKVTNKGLASATHLVLTIYSNAQITNPIISSTENITVSVPQINPKEILQIQAARLVSGQGSNIMINLPKLNAKSLPIYGTYDQGSTRQPPMLNLYDDYLSDSPIIIASIAAIISFIYFLEQRSKINMLRFMAAKIYRDLREVAMMKLESDLHNDKILVDDKLLDGRGMYSNRLWANPKFEGMKIKFFNKVDIDKLYKFFAFLLDRDSVIKYVKPEHESFVARLRDANYKLNRAAQDAYKDINWEKYAGFKFIKFYVLGDVDPKMTVKFRMLFTVKDRKFVVYQLILIGLIVVVVFYPALLSPTIHRIYAGIVYVSTGGLLFLWLKIIDMKELRRSVSEGFEMEKEKQRVRIAEPKKDKKEKIKFYQHQASDEVKSLHEQDK